MMPGTPAFEYRIPGHAGAQGPAVEGDQEGGSVVAHGADLLIQVGQDHAQEQGNQGCHQGFHRDIRHAGSAQGYHGQERPVVKSQGRYGAHVVGNAYLLGQRAVHDAVGVGGGADQGQGSDAQNAGRAKDIADAKAQGHAHDVLDGQHQKSLGKGLTHLFHVNGRAGTEHKHSHRRGRAGTGKKAGGKAADLQRLGEEGVHGTAHQKRDHLHPCGKFPNRIHDLHVKNLHSFLDQDHFGLRPPAFSRKRRGGKGPCRPACRRPPDRRPPDRPYLWPVAARSSAALPARRSAPKTVVDRKVVLI